MHPTRSTNGEAPRVMRRREPDMTLPIVDALCGMAVTFKERGDVSMVALFRESGYDAKKFDISEGG